MCPGSIVVDNTLPQQHPRGRAAQRPTMSRALIRGMRSNATRPEWWLEHRTQSLLPQPPPLRAWRVVDELLHWYDVFNRQVDALGRPIEAMGNDSSATYFDKQSRAASEPRSL